MATIVDVVDIDTAVRHVAFRISVLRCRRTGRILFLEAGKDFVDTLFSFLLLPVGTIIQMLSSAGLDVKVMGGISSLFESMKQPDCSFLHVDKQLLLHPLPAVTNTSSSIGLMRGLKVAKLNSLDFVLPGTYYRCNSKICAYLSSTKGTHCTRCNRISSGRVMTVTPGDLKELKEEIMENLIVDSVEEGDCSTGQGFVRDNITYMVTDQLEIMPFTTIRCIKVLNELKVETLSDLESRDVHVNLNQILDLLQSAMTSSTCLDDVCDHRNGFGSQAWCKWIPLLNDVAAKAGR